VPGLEAKMSSVMLGVLGGVGPLRMLRDGGRSGRSTLEPLLRSAVGGGVLERLAADEGGLWKATVSGRKLDGCGVSHGASAWLGGELTYSETWCVAIVLRGVRCC